MRPFKRLFTLVFSACIALQFGVTSQAIADPPPWAPAHGYYKNKHDKHRKHRRDDQERYQEHDTYYDQRRPSPYIQNGRCNAEQIGTLIGGTLGGVVGSRIGKHDTRTVTTIAGTIIGAFIGSSIGRNMDRVDQTCVGQALEYAEDRQAIAWKNPDTGNSYQITPTRTYEDYGRYCREFTRQALIDGHRQTIYGRACRQQDGSWQIVR